jgi:hypothetical protein
MTTRARIPTPLSPPGGVERYRDHILDELRHDPYQATKKHARLTACPTCGLVFADGRWHRATPAPDAPRVECPACRRVADRMPAGYLTLAGPFLELHRAELLGLVHNVAAAEGEDHPLHRLIGIEEAADEIAITTTDLHLPRRIGEALKHAHGGRLQLRYAPDEYLLRVRWYR